MKKLVTLLGVLFIIFYINFVSAAVLTVCPSGCNSTAIQGAINLASDGDTINVSAGTYNEQPTINKEVILQSVSGASLTLLNCQNQSFCLIILANNVVVNGFTIYNDSDRTTATSKGIDIRGNNSLIKNNIVIGNRVDADEEKVGIYVRESSNNVIDNNEIYNWGWYAINNYFGKNTQIINNYIHNNLYYGISSDRSNNTLIKNNTIKYEHVYAGIVVFDKNTEKAKSSTIFENDIEANGGGIAISGADFVNISNNIIKNNTNYGVRLAYSGWLLSNAENNSVYSNILTNNGNGSVITGSGVGNRFHFNSIYDNLQYGILNLGSGIVNGTFNWWGSCDGPSGIGPGGGDAVYGNINYTPWIVKGVCISDKVNITCAFETDDVILSANLSVKETEMDNAWFSYTINGTNHNKTANYIGGNKYRIIVPSIELVGGTNVTWNVYANDSIKTYKNGEKTFYVRKRTKLNINPPSPDGLNNWYVTEPLFSLLKDSNGSNVYYQWDSDDIFLYTTPFGLENIPNPPKESAGILELNWWTDFGVCGNESKQSNISHIDLTNPLITDLIPENASIVFNNLKPKIYVYLDEVYGSNSGINKTSVIIKVDGADVTNHTIIKNADTLDATINYTPTTDLPIGLHNITINVTDNAGRNSELSWFFNINLTGKIFNLTIYSPENKNYSTKKVVFNITTSEIVSEIKYTNLNDQPLRYRILCRNCNESGFSRKRTQTLNEGENNITIKAVDIYGRVKEENLSLFIDSRKPQVIRQEPKNNGYCNGNFSVKYSEEYLKNVYLYYENNNSVKNDCLSGRNKECKFYVPLTQYENQSINFHFEVEDMFWKVPYRRNHTCLVDTIPPNILNITAPVNESDYTQYVYFNITLDSKAKSIKYIDENDEKIIESTLCLRCSEYGVSITKKKLFSKGDHIMTIIAEDEAGNMDTENIIFTVN